LGGPFLSQAGHQADWSRSNKMSAKTFTDATFLLPQPPKAGLPSAKAAARLKLVEGLRRVPRASALGAGRQVQKNDGGRGDGIMKPAQGL